MSRFDVRAWSANGPLHEFTGCHCMMAVPQVALFSRLHDTGDFLVQAVAEVVYFDGLSQIVTYTVFDNNASRPEHRIRALNALEWHGGCRPEAEFEKASGFVGNLFTLGRRVTLNVKGQPPAYLRNLNVLPSQAEEELLWFRERSLGDATPSDGMLPGKRTALLDEALHSGLWEVEGEHVLDQGAAFAAQVEQGLGAGGTSGNVRLQATVLAVLGQGWQDGIPDVLRQLCQVDRSRKISQVDSIVRNLVARVADHPHMVALQSALSFGLLSHLEDGKADIPSVPLRMSMSQWVQEQLCPDAMALLFSWEHPV